MLTEYLPNPLTNQSGDRTLPQNAAAAAAQAKRAPQQYPTPDTEDTFLGAIEKAVCSAFIFYWMEKWMGEGDASLSDMMSVAAGAVLGTVLSKKWSFDDW